MHDVANKDYVSICLPVYNRQDKIKECINSVLEQTYPYFELIIVDNASTDRTWDVIQSIENSHIKAFRNKENVGAAPNWNIALSKANYPLTLMIHSDDKIAPHFIEQAMKEYQRLCRKVPVIIGQGVYKLNNGKTRTHPVMREKVFQKGTEALLAILNNIPHPSVFLIEKKCYEEAGYYNTGRFVENLAEEIFPRLFSKYNFAYIAEPAIYIGRDENQIGNISWTRDYFIHRYAEMKFQHINLCDISIVKKIKLLKEKTARACYGIAFSTFKRGHKKLALHYLACAMRLHPFYLFFPKFYLKAIYMLAKKPNLKN